ncbi:cytochrome c1 [Physocladia obscura]|uniref:quinol--cytochrome-c reductase n=1 Tax=Physocladia obscura TaxID=109957 RepID=A0AAD5XGK3_9FUNG|nr:cytochrome c1 [Physocladia obscura]
MTGAFSRISRLSYSAVRRGLATSSARPVVPEHNRITAGFVAKTFAVCSVVAVGISAALLDDPSLGLAPSGADAFNLIENGMHPPHLGWEHRAWNKTFDHESIRRGYQVYREICAACHSMSLLSWRNLVGVSHSEDEVKAMAAEYEYQDGPNDQGEYFQRPGKLSDRLPPAYPNEEAARAANGGAYPPDLSCIVKARHGEEDYIFSLLLGYSDPPPGISLRDGLHFNRYFPGGAISMARALYDEVVDYEDGTPNNASQLAKDVTTFLSWASYPEHDDRKLTGMRAITLSVILTVLSVWYKRFKWAPIKTRQIVFKLPKAREV